MSSISVRFNSFLFFYSIFNEHKRTAIPFLLGISVQLYHRELTLDHPLYFPEWRVSARPTGGDDGIRTHDPLLAGQVLSQLSYTPIPRALSFSKTMPVPEN